MMFTLKNILILIGRNTVISLAVVCVAFILINFISKKIERISDSVALNHRLLAELEKRTGLFEVLNRDAQIVGANDILIDNAFVSSDDISPFIDTFDNLGQNQSIKQTYHFETPVLTAISAPFPISTILYSNNITTNVSNFSGYLKAFEKLPYFTKIEGLNISSQNELGWLGESTISFRATLYTKATQ